MKYGATTVFCLTFVVGIITGWQLWSGGLTLDGKLWQQGVEIVAQGGLPGPEHGSYGYPATTILFPAAAIVHLGKVPAEALEAVMIFELALIIAALALVAYLLRPQSYWWAVIAITLLFDRFYLSATPPSALLAPLAALFALLVLMAYERKSLRAHVALGLCGGVMLATRFETSAIVIATAIPFLRFTGKRALPTYLFAGSALATFVVLDPYLWQGPVAHLAGIFEKFLMHAEGVVAATGGRWVLYDALSASITGTLALCLGLWVLLTKSAKELPAPVLAWLAGTSLILLAGLSFSHHHPPWMFLPVLIPWAVLLLPLAEDALRALTEGPRPRFTLSPATLGILLVAAYGLYMLIDVLLDEIRF